MTDLKERYLIGRVGDVEVKQKLARALNNLLEPIRERRAYYECHRDEVLAAVEKGCKEGRHIAQETMAMVKDAMQINYLKRRDIATTGSRSDHESAERPRRTENTPDRAE